MFDAGNRKDIRRAEKEAKLAIQQRREATVENMSTMAKRRYMVELLETCHVFSTSFNRDSHTMAFMEGQRDIGLRLLNDIMASCPNEYILMMREQNERRSASERAREQITDGRDQGPDASDDSIYGDPGGGDEASGRDEVH